MKKLAALLTAAAMLITSLSFTAAAESETADEAAAESTESAESGIFADESSPMFTIPDDMKGAVITPSVDFYRSQDEDGEAIAAELDEIFRNFCEIGLNTVIINTVSESDSYYSIDMNSSGNSPDPTRLAVSAAYSYGISPYVVFDISHVLKDCTDSTQMIDTLVSAAHRFTLRYSCSGIILDDYYMKRSPETYGSYMENGSGIGYKNWLYDTSEQYFRTAAEVIHMTDNSVSVGFIINDMWANSSSNPDGSDTEDEFQSYYDGYADTKSFMESGCTDFALLRTYGSLSSQTLPFENVTGWWGELAEKCGMPIYIIHQNERLGTDIPGWKGEDQILRQLSVSKKLASYNGSIFNSYGSLMENPMGTTDTLMSYFNEQINEQSLFSDLRMTSPASLNFTTSEQSVTFMGTFDSNFPVYFNGKEISLNDAGNFYFKKDLSNGLNTFTVKHKSKTYTYKITRKISVINTINAAIAEGKTLSVDGGTKITLSATAYKGANVYGVINGTTVKMTEASGKNDEDDVNSSYVRYTGTYKVPNGVIGKKQDLGKIMLSGTYSGYTMEVMGAKVIVNAEPEPPKKQEAVIVKDTADTGSGKVIATLQSPHAASESLTYVKTTADYTIVYDGKTADDIPSPIFSQLPANTKEVYKSSSGGYYVTESGKRIAASASVLENGTGIDTNALYVKSIGTSGGNSFIKMKLDNKTGFNMRLAGNSYFTSWEGDYNLNNFTATHLYITFENITSVTKLPSFENNLVFKAGMWDTVTESNGTKFRLVLELRQPGVYFGHSAKYNSDGDLVFSFPVPTNVLSGLTIVIDPGHGYGRSATTFDPGAIGEVVESDVVLGIAKSLTTQLQAAGANVIRLKTESQYLLTKERPIYARGYGCDIYLSIHANKATGEARGVEAYYFTSYSEPLAAEISKSIASYYSGYVYSDGAYKDRGAKWSYYHVTLQQDFPSILIETGFVDNIMDAMALASAKHQEGIASAIVSGIKKFIARSSISYASEGSANAGAQEEKPAETTAAVTENTPEETTAETTADPEEEDPEEEEPETPDDEPEETTAPETDEPEETTAPETDEPEESWFEGDIEEPSSE